MSSEPLSYTSLSGNARPTDVAYRLARWTLAAFVITFICARILVMLIMLRKIPDLYMHMGGNHVHHLNYGIFMLSGVGAYLLFRRPSGLRLRIAAIFYGIGMGLTFDEFGMWLHLGGYYWQRASFDAVVVIAALLTLIAVAPDLRKLRAAHLSAFAIIIALTVCFGILLAHTARKLGNHVLPKLQQIETNGPT
ncbi:MAG TPA: hypothetical protein VMD30_12365 [Tepidisphaeraceae bacterium]|nr:hypothetical protein [Tepidisphaeraceae bacterium]